MKKYITLLLCILLCCTSCNNKKNTDISNNINMDNTPNEITTNNVNKTLRGLQFSIPSEYEYANLIGTHLWKVKSDTSNSSDIYYSAVTCESAKKSNNSNIEDMLTSMMPKLRIIFGNIYSIHEYFDFNINYMEKFNILNNSFIKCKGIIPITDTENNAVNISFVAYIGNVSYDEYFIYPASKDVPTMFITFTTSENENDITNLNTISDNIIDTVQWDE